MNRPPIEEVAGLEFEILRYGSDEPYSYTLLRNLALVEMEPKWKKEILACTIGWGLRFEEVANISSLPGASAGLAQELPDEAKEKDSKDGTAEDLRKLTGSSLMHDKDYVRIKSGDLRMLFEMLDEGLKDRRLIVKRHPLSPQAHMVLGSFLGMVGKYTGNRETITEGINECKIAATLCKDWDTPLVESGIILINAERYDEALVELESAAKKLPMVTPHLAMNRGYALMQTQRYEQALADFEFVIKMKPNHALALDFAAHCAFMLDDHTKAVRFAKEARKYGEPQTYYNWRRGAYNAERIRNQKRSPGL